MTVAHRISQLPIAAPKALMAEDVDADQGGCPAGVSG
jgi:hypothetical protein